MGSDVNQTRTRQGTKSLARRLPAMRRETKYEAQNSPTDLLAALFLLLLLGVTVLVVVLSVFAPS